MKKVLVLIFFILGYLANGYAVDLSNVKCSITHSDNNFKEFKNDVGIAQSQILRNTDLKVSALSNQNVNNNISQTKVTRNLNWSVQTDREPNSVAEYEIFINGVSMVGGTTDNDPSSLCGTLQVSDGDVISVTFKYFSGCVTNYRDVWIQNGNNIKASSSENIWLNPTTLTYTIVDAYLEPWDLDLYFSLYAEL